MIAGKADVYVNNDWSGGHFEIQNKSFKINKQQTYLLGKNRLLPIL